MSDPIDSYKTATEIRNLEIKLFWQRSNYFLVLNTAVATGALLKIDKPEFAFPLSIFGFLVSLMWISINLGSKFWQDRWERKIAKIELSKDSSLEMFAVSRQVIDQEVKESLRYDDRKWYQFWKRLVNFLVMFKPSVSRTMILLSFTFSFFWIGIGLNSFGIQLNPKSFNQQANPAAADSTSFLQDSVQLAIPVSDGTAPNSSIFSWESIWNFVAVFVGILLSFWIERRIAAKRELSMSKSLVLLVADEIERNITLMEQIVSQAQQSVVPYYQLVSENKDACWSLLVEYPFSQRDLTKKISASYFEYRLINRTLDMIFFKEGVQSPLFGQSTIPLCNAEIKRSKDLLLKLRDWANK